MAASQGGFFNVQSFSDGGAPLALGRLYTFSPSTTTKKLAYTNAAGTIPHTYTTGADLIDYIALDARGELPAPLYLTSGGYDIRLNRPDGSVVWTRRANGNEDSANTALTDLASTADNKGAELVGFSHANTAAATTVALALQAKVNVKNHPFNATGDSTTDDTAAIQAAIDSLSTTGGTVWIPPGTYKCTGTLTMRVNVIIQGAGKRAATLAFTHTGDGIKMTSSVNSSTAVNTAIRDIGFTCSNGSNTGGAYVDVGGTFVHVEHCYIQGFKYGVVYDQTEIATISKCVFNGQLGGGVWLCNYADHTATALPNFTNRITINDNQFNVTNTAYCIIDDGGVMHTVENNNFNHGINAIRVSGVSPLTIRANECEVATGACVTFKNTTLAGTAVGLGTIALLEANTFIPVAAQFGVDAVSASSIVSIGNNYSSTSSAAASINIGTVFHFKGIGDRAGVAIAGVASFHYTNDALLNGFPIATSGRKFGNAGTASSGTVTNTLINNYEEGTFVPTIVGVTTSGAGTYTTQVATYTRTGNTVQFSIALIWTAHTGTGAMKIAGLPFAAKNTAGMVTPFATVYDTLVIGAGKQLGAAIIPAATQISMYSLDVAGGALALLAMDTAASLYVSGTYQV